MNNRNATASWSGYSHQGQVGLLVALRKLQEDGIDLSNHFVEFENTEDVAIYEKAQDDSKNFISVHQVKAYYSAGNNTKSKYTAVLNDPFQGSGTRYLHTVVEIADWATSTVTNNNNVERYPYSSTQFHCDTTDIEQFIKDELETILIDKPYHIEVAYKKISFALDNLIRNEHKKASKKLFDIKLSLQEILEIINNEDEFIQKDIYECRKIFYDTFKEIIQYIGIEEEKREILEEGVIKWINELDDDNFRKFLVYLNLNESKTNLSKSHILSNKNGLKQVFFHVLLEAIDLEPLSTNNVVKFIKKNYPSELVLTAIIEEEMFKSLAIKNILENLDSMNLLWENHQLINKEIDANLITDNPDFKSIPEDGSGTIDSKNNRNRFMYYSNTELISRQKAIQLLNDTSNN
ncbi:ABC-three component system protein [Empedobacter falsenii]